MDYDKTSDALVNWDEEEAEVVSEPLPLLDCTFVECKVWNLHNIRDYVWGDE